MPRLKREKDHTCICFGQRPRTVVSFDGSVEMSERLHNRAWRYWSATSDARAADDRLSQLVAVAAKTLGDVWALKSPTHAAAFLAIATEMVTTAQECHDQRRAARITLERLSPAQALLVKSATKMRLEREPGEVE